MLKSLRRKTIGDLRANWGQFLAVWLVVTLGTTFYGAMYPAGVNLLDSMYRTYDQLRFLDFQVQLDSAPPDTVEAVRAIPGVAYVEGRLVVEAGLQIDPERTHLLGLRMISLPDQGQAEVTRSAITEGDSIQGVGEILLLERFADTHGIRPGDTLRVVIGGEGYDLRVAGLAFNPEYLVAGRSSESPFPTPSTFGVAWMHYSELARYSGHAGEINDIAVRLEGRSEEPRTALKAGVRAALTDLFAGQNAVILGLEQTASGGVIDANVNGNFPIMVFYSGLFLAGSVVVTGILMARLVESERRRIGTLRAMGVTRHELVLHYLTFGFIIGVCGGIVGSVLGYLNSFWFMYTFLDYIAGGTLPGFTNTPQIPFILLGFLIVVAGSTLAGAYPAWVQSGTAPGIALRPAVPQTPNALSRLRLGFLSLPLRQAVRNLLRAPGRAVGTALGVMAGSMMMFSAVALWDTTTTTFNAYYDATAFDLRVDMATLRPGDTLEAQVGAINGIDGAQAALVGGVSIANAEGQQLDTVAVALDETDPFFDLRTLAGDPAFSRADGVWIGHNVQHLLGVDPGDTLIIHAFDQDQTVAVRGVVSYVLGSPVFVPRSLLQQWTPGGIFPANTVLVRAAAGQEAAVQDAVSQLSGVVAAESLGDYERDLKHYVDYYLTNTLLFGSFGLVLTLALLFNTVNASLRERREELAVLRALGTTGRAIALTVTIELLVMVVIGVVVGVPMGCAAGSWLTHTYDTDFFRQVDAIKTGSYIFGILSLFVAVVLAEIPGLRAVHRIDLGQVSKSQSF
jgi:putative ABC transport system permease protein